MESLPNYDRWKTGNWGEDSAAEDDSEPLICDICGSEIKEDNLYYIIYDGVWCTECIEKHRHYKPYKDFGTGW